MERTLLVVDDDADIVETLRIALEGEGYRVLTARNGEEALGVLERERPDAILLDLMMPVLDGREMCRRMQDSERLRGIPVVVMTAADRFDADPCPCSAFVKKPFRLEEVLGSVAEAVGGTAPGG